MMYFRQIATATAIYGFLALAGLLPAFPTLANDVAPTDRFYDVMQGDYVSIGVKETSEPGQNAESSGEQAAIPSHVQQTLNTH